MKWKCRNLIRYLGVLLLIILYIHGWSQIIDEDFVDLHTCPACYGQSRCSAMLEKENFDNHRIKLASYSRWKFMRYFNVKNVYYALYGEDHVVLKKLAHDSELREINEKFCKASKLPPNCNVSQAIKSIVAKAGNDIAQVIDQHRELFEESDAVRCQHSRNVIELFEKYVQKSEGEPYHTHHFLTMLAVNMEPLLMRTHHSQWFPAVIGTCGRIIIEEYVGPTLTQLGDEPWVIRADYARQLLEMAQQLSEGEFHLYMTDVSLDNFAVDKDRRVQMIDAENLVMVDSTLKELDDSEHVNDGFGCKDCLSFSFEDLCGHKNSDHNYFAVCKGMLSSTSFSQDIPEGLLHSPPVWVSQEYPSLFTLVEECAAHPQDVHNYSKPRRKEAVAALHSVLSSVVNKYLI